MDKLAIRCVLAEISRLPISKAAADRNDEIRRTDGIVRSFLPVHPGKTEHLRVRTPDGAHTHKSMHDR